jgi:putative peptidoglycan lipid II flippase
MAQTLFLLPWAVLSLPIATTAFPRLAAAWQAGQIDAVRRRLGASMHVLIAAAAAGTAVLAAVARPAGLLLFGAGAPSLRQFAPATTAFAVGLIGWSLVALLARALYATDQVRMAAAAQVAGQLVVIAADIALSALLPRGHRALALGLGNSAGVAVAAALLLVGAVRVGIVHLDAAWWRRLVVVAAAAAVAAVVGASVGRRSGLSTLSALGTALGAAVVATLIYGAVLAVLDRQALRQLLAVLPSTTRP